MSDFSKRRVTMVDTQVRPSDVTKFTVLDAMLSVPREAYVPDAQRGFAYMDNALPVAEGRELLSPRAIGKMLDALAPTPQDLVLEIGAGGGYATALLAHMCEAVIAVEEDADLAGDAVATLAEQGVDNAVIVEAPLVDGDAKHGPYDAVAVFGGVEDLPATLLDQLKDGGKIIAIFVAGAVGEARLGVKSGGAVSWRMLFNQQATVLPGFARAASFAF